MNKPKFTPGPWEVEETEDGHVIKMGNAIEREGRESVGMEGGDNGRIHL